MVSRTFYGIEFTLVALQGNLGWGNYRIPNSYHNFSTKKERDTWIAARPKWREALTYREYRAITNWGKR